MNAPLETMGGRGREFFGAHTISAYRWLAKSRGVDLATVVAAAERGRLVDIVEMRAHGKTLSPGRPGPARSTATTACRGSSSGVTSTGEFCHRVLLFRGGATAGRVGSGVTPQFRRTRSLGTD
jgi:hypothetical protein